MTRWPWGGVPAFVHSCYFLLVMSITESVLIQTEQVFQFSNREVSFYIFLFIYHTTAQSFFVGLTLKDLFFNSTCLKDRIKQWYLTSLWKARWPLISMLNDLLWIEQSGIKPRLRTLCCVLGQDTLFSECLSPPRCFKIMGTGEFNAEVTLRWTSIPSKRE